MNEIDLKGIAMLLEQQRKASLDRVVANAKAAAARTPNLANLAQAYAKHRREQDEQVARLLANKSR
jgi:hypothetical protein